jgi:hypothetical protein
VARCPRARPRKGRWLTFLRGVVSRFEGWGGRHARPRRYFVRSEELLAGLLKQILCHRFPAFISVSMGASFSNR